MDRVVINCAGMFAVRGIVAVLAALALAAPAFGAPHHPTGEFEQFGDCPLSLKATTDCVYAATHGGSMTIGKKTVPIKSPVILQGGFQGSGEEVKFLGAESGQTLSKSAQTVPGGLLGVTAPTSWPQSLQEWFNDEIENGVTGVKATLELAAPASAIKLSTENLINQEGVALGLPVRIKLDNPLLGSNCYVGSNSKPVQIDFTTGKSGAVAGDPGTLTFNKKYTLITISGGRLANGTFAAPAASGCGGLFSFFIDPLVNSILGLPAGSGENTAILAGNFKSAAAASVRNSE
jgi:hypothetical protein